MGGAAPSRSMDPVSMAAAAVAVVSNGLSRRVKPAEAVSVRMTHKVPLHMAVSAAVTIQRRVRVYLAIRKLAKLKNRSVETHRAAADYLNGVRTQRFQTDRHNETSILRRSWMQGADNERGFGSFSMEDRSSRGGSGGLIKTMRASFDDRQFRQHPQGGNERDFDSVIVYPFAGFVLKAKFLASGRKVFINLSHHPRVTLAAASPMRLWTEEKHHDDDGELIVEEVVVVDLVLPTPDFEDRFVYKGGQGLVPVSADTKDHLSNLVIMLLNGMDHCPDSFSAPISSMRSSEEYRLSPHTNWPRIKRGYVGNILPMIYDPTDSSLVYAQPFRLSRDPPPVTTQVVAAMCPPEVRAWMSIALSSIGSSFDALSNIARVGQGDHKFKQFEDLDKGIEDDLEAHQKQYVCQVRRLKEGYRVFVVVNQGLLYIYTSDSADSNGDVSNLSLPYPYGKQEMIRFVMSSIELETSADLVNDLFFLHLDFVAEELESLFVLSKFLNMISSTVVNPRKLTLQFHNYSEQQTWKMIFEQHSQYAQYAMARIATLAPAVKFHGVTLATMPSSKATWLTERFGLRARRRLFAKIDRGWFIIFPNDNSVTPSLTNASEIFSLANVRCEVTHRKVVRLRKWITKISLYNDATERKREFFFRSADGELDAETKALLNALGSNITYAHSQFFRYVLPWLDDNDALGDFSSSTTAATGAAVIRTTMLNLVGCTVDLQILIPEPQTSDDDSDLEAEKDLDESVSGAVFRVLRPRIAGMAASERSTNSGGLNRSKTASSTVDMRSRFQQVNEKLQSEYNNFSPGYFQGRILLYQDHNILLLLHANRLLGMVNISRCLEKSFPDKKAKRAQKKPVDTSIYSLGSSSDDDSSSDRDYFEDANPLAAGEDESVKNWVIQLLGYDGRIYRIKFSNITEFDDWKKSLQARCVTPANPGSSAKVPPKGGKSDSFKGNHTFEFLKEHSISSAESTASTGSLSSVGSGNSATSSLLSSMLSGAGKIVNSIRGEEPKAWEPVIDSEASKRFARSLRVSEKVYASGIVLKHEKTVNNATAASAPKQKRILLVTDAPRMIFIDTIGNVPRGSVDLLKEVEIREADASDFEVVVAGAVHRFTPQDSPEKDAKNWVRVLKFATKTA